MYKEMNKPFLLIHVWVCKSLNAISRIIARLFDKLLYKSVYVVIAARRACPAAQGVGKSHYHWPQSAALIF